MSLMQRNKTYFKIEYIYPYHTVKVERKKLIQFDNFLLDMPNERSWATEVLNSFKNLLFLHIIFVDESSKLRYSR